VALVLLMGCANVASLLLARGAAREQELSIRAALGGGRRRLFQQLLTENLIMALAGGAVGLLLAAWGTRALAGLVPPDLPRGDEIEIDWIVLTFTAAVSVVTGVLFGVIPAWRAARTDVIGVLKVGGSAAGDQGGRLRRALIAIQVAVVLVLLCAAGLLLNSLWRMTTVDPGFDTRRVMTMYMRLANQTCGEPARRETFSQRLLERVRTVPGVLQATSSSDLPFSSGGLIGFQLPGGTPHGHNFAELYLVDHEYLPLMQIALRRGRLLDRSDRKGGMVAVVNEAFAEQVFPGVNPLGQRVIVKDPYEIVGVVSNHREMLARGPTYSPRNAMNEATGGPRLRAMSLPAIYIPSAQADFVWCTFYLIVRTGPDPRGIAGPIRKEIAAIEPDLPVQSVATLAEWAGADSASTSFYAAVLTIFALVAVVLAAVGIYGVLAQAVGQRVREIGVRMALGATRARIVWLIGWQMLVVVGIGLGVGLGVALGSTRALASFLFDLAPTDPVTYAVVITLLILVAAVAAYFPARRATQVEPMTALRWE
jgi:predicted permease